MKKLYMIAFLVMGMALTGCKKPVAYESPEIKETSVELQSASVCFTATVNFTGNAEMVLELATLQDMSDKQEYTMNQIDETSFSVNVLDLEPYVDYFYRMVVSNANFTQSSSVKRFSIGSEMVSDGDDKLKLGYLNIPILANYYVIPGLAIKAGVQPGFLLSAKDEDGDDEKDGMNSFDLSIPIGASYEYKNFVFDARYNFGLTKINKHGSNSHKNSVFMITVGYKFAL